MPGSHTPSSPAIASERNIYQATFGGELLALTPQGKVKWTFQIRKEIHSSPAIGDNETICVGNVAFVYAINNATNHVAPLAKSSWPMFRADPRRTGRVEMEKSE